MRCAGTRSTRSAAPCPRGGTSQSDFYRVGAAVTFNHGVEGSSPSALTKKNHCSTSISRHFSVHLIFHRLKSSKIRFGCIFGCICDHWETMPLPPQRETLTRLSARRRRGRRPRNNAPLACAGRALPLPRGPAKIPLPSNANGWRAVVRLHKSRCEGAALAGP